MRKKQISKQEPALKVIMLLKNVQYNQLLIFLSDNEAQMKKETEDHLYLVLKRIHK